MSYRLVFFNNTAATWRMAGKSRESYGLGFRVLRGYLKPALTDNLAKNNYNYNSLTSSIDKRYMHVQLRCIHLSEAIAVFWDRNGSRKCTAKGDPSMVCIKRILCTKHVIYPNEQLT